MSHFGQLFRCINVCMVSVFVLLFCTDILAAANATEFDSRYALYGALLTSSVEQGRVDYVKLRAQSPALQNVLKKFEELAPENLNKMNKNDQLAFYLNAYNARVLYIVVSHIPIKSIMDISGAFKEQNFRVAGKTLTLDRLENEVIRPVFRDARIHFALNCAARGCPVLRSQPYIGESLDKQLDAAVTAFVNDPDRIKIDAEKKRVEVSKIFEWFASDFVEKYGKPGSGSYSPEQRAMLNFVAAYLTDKKQRSFLQTGNPTVVFSDYDWALNSR